MVYTGVREWLEVVTEATSTLSTLGSLQQQVITLSASVVGGEEWQQAESLVSGLQELVQQVLELKQLEAYFKWLKQIQSLR